ncbi:hypothetical protein CRG98_012025 [Punica granatum]|uniref:Uncharacterized protein n=1 Tax=Punica granatum TaxID=22663 RepID=A0A2I0KGH1_PUNGR|nr:hypothetical protein CRG98_012025 [Punica granatum]
MDKNDPLVPHTSCGLGILNGSGHIIYSNMILDQPSNTAQPSSAEDSSSSTMGKPSMPSKQFGITYTTEEQRKRGVNHIRVNPDFKFCTGVSPLRINPDFNFCTGVNPFRVNPDFNFCTGVNPDFNFCTGVNPLRVNPDFKFCTGVNPLRINPDFKCLSQLCSGLYPSIVRISLYLLFIRYNILHIRSKKEKAI